jgi:hypothetical protein
MKYIITESQYNLLSEGIPLSIKRRFKPEVMESHIFNAQVDINPCDFSDEFEYADNIITWALDNFLTVDESIINDMMGDDYDDITEILSEKMKDWYSDYLFDEYLSSCGENELEDEDI